MFFFFMLFRFDYRFHGRPCLHTASLYTELGSKPTAEIVPVSRLKDISHIDLGLNQNNLFGFRNAVTIASGHFSSPPWD